MKNLTFLLLSILLTLRAVYAQTASDFPEKPENISPLLIGETIPALTLPDANGKSTDLKALVSQKPTILVFYRGGWCPFCNKQLGGLQEVEAELRQIGYQIVALSTDSPENLHKTVEKSKLTYTLLADHQLDAAKSFGIAFKAPKGYGDMLIKASEGANQDKLLPVASVFILNTQGQIQFEYINPNYQERLNPTILKVVAKALLERK